MIKNPERDWILERMLLHAGSYHGSFAFAQDDRNQRKSLPSGRLLITEY